MILSCTEAGKLLNMSKEEVRELVDKDILSNYGNHYRSMVDEDELKEYIRLSNNEITKKEFEKFKIQNMRSYETILFNDIEYMENATDILKNAVQEYIEEKASATNIDITNSQLEREIYKTKEELEERIFEAENGNPQNEKAIFQYQCEIRGMDKVLEILEIQKGSREIL